MGTHGEGYIPRGHSFEQSGAGFALVPTCEHHAFDPGFFSQGRDRCKMLLRQNFCRRHQNSLPSGLNRVQHRHQGDDRLAAAHIPLQQTQHAVLSTHIAGDIRDRGFLAAGQREGQGVAHLLLQSPGARRDPAGLTAHMSTDQGNRELTGEHFIEGETAPGQGAPIKIGLFQRGMGGLQGVTPAFPAAFLHKRRIEPLRQLRGPLQGTGNRLAENVL